MANREPVLASDALLRQAEEMCRRRLASDGDNRSVLTSLALICRKRGNLSEATRLYERLTQLDPDNLDAQYMFAILAGNEVPVRSAGLRPAPFVLIRNFLPRAFHETLLPFVLSVQDKLVPADISGGDDKRAYNPEARESLDLPGEFEVKQRFGRIISDIIPTVMSRLHVAPFELCDLEVKVRAYLDGHFFRMHMDCPPGTGKISRRRVSYVYFFHKVPRQYGGGDLLLFDSDIEASRFTTSAFTSVAPEDNSLILFPSAYFHSVLPISCPSRQYVDSRFVINGHVGHPATVQPAEHQPAAASA